MKKRFIFGFVAVLGLTSITSVKWMHKQTEFAPFHQTIGSLTYEVHINRNYNMLNVHAKVTNVGTEPIAYHTGSSSCPIHIGVEITNSNTNSSLEGQPRSPNICTTDSENSNLAPNQTVEDNWIFNIPKKGITSKIQDTYAGTYDVKVWLFPETSVFLSKQPVKRENAMTQITIF